VLRPPPTQGPFGRDFEAYYAAGATWDAGGDPWSRDVWRVERTVPGVDASRDELLPYAGPAALLPLLGALARLPFDGAVALWTLLLTIAVAALAAAALALAGVPVGAALLPAVALALMSGPGTSDIALGQAAALSAAGVALMLLACERGMTLRATLGAAAATLLAGAQPNLALPLIARLRDPRALAAATGGGIAFLALTLAAGGGFTGFAHYVALLAAHGGAERFDAIQYTATAIAFGFGAPPDTALAIAAGCACVAIAGVAAAIVALRLDARDGTFAGIAALPFAVPFFHEHDFVVLALPLLVLAVSARGAARAWAGAAAPLAFVDWFGLAQRPLAQPQILVAGLAVAALFVALRARRPGPSDATPFAVLALIALLAVPAARHAPAPVWPDALPPHYSVPARASASEVWHAEQHAAGLDRRVAEWASLRTLPLLGCGCLFIAICLNGRRTLHTTPAA